MQNDHLKRLIGFGLLTLVFAMGGVGCGDAPAAPVPPVATYPTVAEPTPAVASGEATSVGVPRITHVSFVPDEPVAGDVVRVVIEATDPKGDPLWFDYDWKVAGAPQPDATTRVSLAGAVRGESVDVRVVASNGKQKSSPYHASVLVHNSAPHLTRVSLDPAGEFVAGTPLTVRPNALDADGDEVTFEYSWRINDAITQHAGPILSTERLERGDTVQVAVVATDGERDSEPIESVRLRIINTPPRITSRPGQLTDDGVFRYQVEALDPDDGQLQFYLSDAPSGMTINAFRGSITWTPGPDQMGETRFRVGVDDLNGGRSEQTVAVTVALADDQPPASER